MPVLRKGYWWLAFAFVLLGIGVALHLTIDHYRVLQTGFTGKTFCNINSYLNCDIVLSSRYSKIAGIPLAGLGLLFYVYLGVLLVAARLSPEDSGAKLFLPFLLCVASVLGSVFLAYVSFYQLHSFCIFCSSLYLINIVLALAFYKLSDVTGAAMKNFSIKKWKTGLIAFLAVFGIGIILLQTSNKQYAREIPKGELEAYLRDFFRQKVYTFDTTGRPFWGNQDAKIVIVEFSDFECPYCKLAAFNLKPILADYQDKVKLVFLQFPLDQSCNVGMTKEGHKQACQVSYASYCAMEQGKFWEFHDEAFDRQPKFAPDKIEKMATKLKLDLNKFKACQNSEAAKNFVADDINQGIRADVPGTPSLFVNGRAFGAWQSKTAFHKLLDQILQSQDAPK